MVGVNLYDHAACAGRDDIDWFPLKKNSRWGDVDYDANLRAAREVCEGCPVRGECMAVALAEPMSAGIWGGMDEHERAGRAHRGPVVCGTLAGYAAHLANREPTCADCRAANAARVRSVRQRATPTGRTHGRRSTYTNAHCRCDACCKAERDYKNSYRRKKRERAANRKDTAA